MPAPGRAEAAPRGYPQYVDASYTHAPDWDSEGFLHYWRILSRGKWTVAAVALASGVVALLVTMAQAPSYRAHASLEVQNLNEDFLNMRNLNPTASTGGFQSPEYNIRTQTAILQSRPILEKAIDRKDLEQRLLVNKRGLLGALYYKVKGERTGESVPARERALTKAEAGLSVHAEPNTRVIDITFDARDPQLAADLANALASAFIETSLEKRWQASQSTGEWLGRQLQDLKTKLRESEAELQRQANASHLTFISEKDNPAEDRLRQVQESLSRAQAERVEKQSRYELATKAAPESLPEVLDDPTLKDYQVELTKLRRTLAELSSSFTPAHPQVAKVEAQIVTMEAALDRKRANILSRIKNEYEATLRRENLLRADYAAQTGLLAQEADKVNQYFSLKRDVDATRQLYDSMFQKVKEAGLATAMRASDISVIEPARPPRLPHSPNFYLNIALGLFSGLCIGASIVIRRAVSDRGIQEPGDISLHLQVPELGVIPASCVEFPRVQRAGANSSVQLLPARDRDRLELTTWQQSPSVLAESFRLTLTSILLSERNGSPLRVIALTSANPGEGKTTVISNLGIALAQIKRRVLLVDGDMRKPRLHDVFDVDNSVGLSDLLAGTSPPAVKETRVPNLFVLPSGAGGDERLLFTPELSDILQRLKADFDMILIDTPPLLQMSDARLLGHQADAVILVVAQHTTRDAALMARQRLAEDGTHLLGTILNNWSPKAGGSGSGDETYSYYYYKSH